MIEGSRVAVTDGTGQYNVTNLRPGTYSVTFTLPGFGTQVRDELVLAAGFAMDIDVALSVGALEEAKSRATAAAEYTITSGSCISTKNKTKIYFRVSKVTRRYHNVKRYLMMGAEQEKTG